MVSTLDKSHVPDANARAQNLQLSLFDRASAFQSHTVDGALYPGITALWGSLVGTRCLPSTVELLQKDMSQLSSEAASNSCLRI